MLLPLLLLPGPLLAQQSGLAIGGGSGASASAEFWAPGELHCSLPSLNREMADHTVNSWQDKLIACSGDSCDQLTASGWQHWRNTQFYRSGHTSAVTSRGLLLVGGRGSSTLAEFLSWDEGEYAGGFNLADGRGYHCSIQTSPSTVVLTGGLTTESQVTELSGLAAGETVSYRELPGLLQGREGHACGYYNMGTTQVKEHAQKINITFIFIFQTGGSSAIKNN